jgi:hypothetical protein
MPKSAFDDRNHCENALGQQQMSPTGVAQNLSDNEQPNFQVSGMCSFHGVLSGEEILAIDKWVGEWIEAASAYGWTRLPGGTGDAMIVAMQVCYRRKLTAREAVEFCFRIHLEAFTDGIHRLLSEASV